MKSILALLLFAEVLFFGIQALATHFQKEHQALPYFGERLYTPGTTNQSQSTSTTTLKKTKKRKKTGGEDSLLNDFESMHKGQLAKLDLIKDLHPMAESSGSAASEEPADLRVPLPSPPGNLKEFQRIVKRTFWDLEPKMGLVWFQSHLNFPIIIRILAYIPPVFLPWILISGLFSARGSRGEYKTFLKSLRGIHFFPAKPYKNFENSYSLWRKPTIQGQFKKEGRKLKKQWFRVLLANQKRLEGLNFGSVLFNEDRKDAGFAEELCQAIINSNEGIDRRYSALLTWYLGRKGSPELAWEIFQKAFSNASAGELDLTAKKLLHKIAAMCPNQEPKQLLSP